MAAPEPHSGASASDTHLRVPRSLPPECRLRRKKEFEEVFARGQRVAGRPFACHVLIGESSGTRLGVAVSRKVGKAVVRNRVKRGIREFYRNHRHRLRQGVRIVVVARPSAATLTAAEVSAELARLLRRGGAYEA